MLINDQSTLDHIEFLEAQLITSEIEIEELKQEILTLQQQLQERFANPDSID